tara:strand:+ start:10493 stop:10705 length:213 start_codon:yes stop_codon:yes gene_type:complete
MAITCASSLDSSQIIFQKDFRTWTSNPPIAKGIDLSKLSAISQGGIVIAEIGKLDGWMNHLYGTNRMTKR